MPSDSRMWTRLAGTAVLACALAGCPRTIAQDKATAKDGKPKGARSIKLDDDGEGRSKKDIITYPGGDRVDWKVFEVPAGKFGSLNVKVHFSPPRPGLDVAFNVYDQYYQRIARAKATPGTGRRVKRVALENVEAGKYFVQVYAPRRTDAGEYRVTVRFTETPRPTEAAVATDIPEPPTLPAIPEAVEPAATPTTPVETPTDPLVPAVEPIAARVVKYQVATSGTLIVTVDKGKTAGVETGWKGQIIASSGRPLEGGDFTVTKVTSSESVGKVGLSVDQIKSNRKVMLSPQ